MTGDFNGDTIDSDVDILDFCVDNRKSNANNRDSNAGDTDIYATDEGDNKADLYLCALDRYSRITPRDLQFDV